MDEIFSADRPAKLWSEIQILVADRARAETEIAADYAREKERIDSQFALASKKTVEDHQRQRTEAEACYVAARKAVVHRCDSEHAALAQEYDRVRAEAKSRHKQTKARENQRLKDARWEATTVFEATKDGPPRRLEEFEKQVSAHRQAVAALVVEADHLLARRWQRPLAADRLAAAASPGDDPAARFALLLPQAQQQWNQLLHQRIPRWFEGGQWVVFGPLLWLLAVAPVGFGFGWTRWGLWVPTSVVVAVVCWAGLLVWLYRIAKRQTSEVCAALRQTVLDAEAAADKALAEAREQCRREQAAIAERLHVELETASQRFAMAMTESRTRRDAAIKEADEHYPPRMTDLIVQRERELERLETEHTREMAEFETRCRGEVEDLEKRYADDARDLERRHEEAWSAMADRWRTGMSHFQDEVDQLNEANRQRFFDWTSLEPSQWSPTEQTPSAVPLGRMTVDLAMLDGGVPADERLRTKRTQFALPALFAFPNRSVLFKVGDQGRSESIEAIQAIMLHVLCGARPGKVRFTIIDPVGLGESFSAFMHLADFDEQAISSRIWTESGHIEQQLVKLTEHMETVIQVYLRNEFDTIQAYNDFAGEMAEPCRVLVVANFPANFSESAARRLLSIVSSGARCGVHVLASVDTRLKLPHGVAMGDLESQMLELIWQRDRFVWKGADLGSLPLELDRPPDPKKFTDLVRAAGERIHDADRVEVPFEFVVPQQEDWWTGDTARQLDVPLGRAGAMKLQHLSLGRGTSQHVLVAGKTGSGKSNLLHAIITNVALWYAPDQVELYLVDFKKGVEFKAYAETRLPHARVVAIESEREFGLSVLERLDAELKVRGDRFRQLGVQDLAAWRRDRPEEMMPRILLVIDEFQELFVEDDRISQNAALLLDRLVRQGRAFGMHVLLGSQTLAGAYSLPRATIGQMAVRIALQCGEADAHLILSEENTAARLLTRPGEAIYNDANGLFEGNHPFQVVWLPDHEKTSYLGRLRDWAGSRQYRAAPPIVFEGNAAADPGANPLLESVLAGDVSRKPGEPARAWLGAAVAIKEPTSVLFRRQGGSNLLLVGHDEEAALGILATSIVSLAAQLPPPDVAADAGPAFHILDGTRPEAPEAGFWRRFCGFLPGCIDVVDPTGLTGTIGRIAEELARRQAAGIDNAPPLYLVVFNLGRFRELRREEDVFRFSGRDDDTPQPAAQFATILREGPAFGIHTLVWCDTCNTLGRWLQRQSIHDVEMRVAFQMSAGDSSTLIDSADAGRLGAHRAILYDEGRGQMEKFRPYGLPTDAWLAQVGTLLGTRR